MANFLYHLFCVGVFVLIWSIGFKVCRLCSMYFDDAKCKRAFTIKNVNLRRILIASTYLNCNKKTVFQSTSEREKISILGVFAHCVINCTGLKLVYTVIQKEFFSKQISDVKQAISIFCGVVIIFVCLELLNNWKVFASH